MGIDRKTLMQTRTIYQYYSSQKEGRVSDMSICQFAKLKINYYVTLCHIYSSAANVFYKILGLPCKSRDRTLSVDISVDIFVNASSTELLATQSR